MVTSAAFSTWKCGSIMSSAVLSKPRLARSRSTITGGPSRVAGSYGRCVLTGAGVLFSQSGGENMKVMSSAHPSIAPPTRSPRRQPRSPTSASDTAVLLLHPVVLDLQGHVRNAETLMQRLASGLQHRSTLGGTRCDEVSGKADDAARDGPHMEIMHLLYAGNVKKR